VTPFATGLVDENVSKYEPKGWRNSRVRNDGSGALDPERLHPVAGRLDRGEQIVARRRHRHRVSRLEPAEVGPRDVRVLVLKRRAHHGERVAVLVVQLAELADRETRRPPSVQLSEPAW